jgi:PIN domain nuclease of toxin-antitoxin system
VANVLLDTHTLIWLLSLQPMRADALEEMTQARLDRTLFVSPITAWEAGTSDLKINVAKRPDLLGQPADIWFQQGLRTA